MSHESEPAVVPFPSTYAAPEQPKVFSITPEQLKAFAWELDEKDLTGAIHLMLSVLNKKRKGITHE